MTIIQRDQVAEFNEGRLVYDVDDELGPVNERIEWNPGSSGANEEQLREKLRQALVYFADNYRDWGSMTNAQKDQALRQTQRALANVARYLLRDLSTGGD